jgi:hypothetical protein
MAGFLGGLFGILVGLLIFVAVPLSVALVILAHCADRARRMWRRWQAERRPRQPYYDAYQRAVWDGAAENGRRAALEDLRALGGEAR